MCKRILGYLLGFVIVATTTVLGWLTSITLMMTISWMTFHPDAPAQMYPKWQQILGICLMHSGLIIGLVIGVFWARTILCWK